LKNNVPREEFFNIKKAVNVRGGGVLLVMKAGCEKNKILGDKIIKDSNLKVSEPVNVKPKIVIYNVDREISPEQIKEEIYVRNFQNHVNRQKWDKEFNPLFKIGPKDRDRVHWVIECSPEIRKELINSFKIYIEWTSCKVKDYVSVSRCYKCQALGHVSKYCKKEKDVCSHCASEGHNFKSCPNTKNGSNCVNCKK
jgi:hypothetical protein